MQTILNYPFTLIGNNGYNNISIVDSSFTSIDDYEYYLYFLYDKYKISSIDGVVVNGETQTQLSIGSGASEFNIGDVVYLLDENKGNFGVPKIGSNSYKVIAKPDTNSVVIDRPGTQASNTSSSDVKIYLSHSTGFTKFADYRTAAANFLVDQRLFDLRATELSGDTKVVEDQCRGFFTVMTYASKQLVSSYNFEGYLYEQSNTGTDSPWVYATDSPGSPALGIEKGDTINIEWGRITTYLNGVNKVYVSIGYETIIENDVDVYYMRLRIFNENGGGPAQFNWRQMGVKALDSIKFYSMSNIGTETGDWGNILPDPNIQPIITSFQNTSHQIKSVDGIDVVLNTPLTTTQKTAIESQTIVIGNDGSNVSNGSIVLSEVTFDGYIREGSFTVLDSRYINGELQIQFNGRGAGYPIPTDERISYSNLSNISLSLLESGNKSIETEDVTVNDWVAVVNTQEKDLSNYIVVDDSFNSTTKFLTYKGNFETDQYGNFPYGAECISFNDMKWVNIAYKPLADGTFPITKIWLEIKFPSPAGYYRFYCDIDYTGVDNQKPGVISINLCPALMVESGQWISNLGEPMTIEAWQPVEIFNGTFKDIDYIFIRPVTEGGTALGEASEYPYKESECSAYDKYRLIYRDSLGSFNGLNFTLGNTETVTSKSTTYESNDRFINDNYQVESDKFLGGTTITNKKITKSYQLISDWISEEQVEYFKQAFESTQCFLQKEEDTTIDNLIGVMIKDTTFVKKTTSKEGLIQYIINVEENIKINLK